MTARWQAEKQKLASAQKLKEELERARLELDQAQRRGDWAKAGELTYGPSPSWRSSWPRPRRRKVARWSTRR